jgi:AcrR family transcriptional regulator
MTDLALDPRVRRTRAAVLRAAVDLVSERGTTAVTISEIAAAANVSRRAVYQHFGDLDAVLLEAGLDLARRELWLLGEVDGPRPAGPGPQGTRFEHRLLVNAPAQAVWATLSEVDQ